MVVAHVADADQVMTVVAAAHHVVA